MIKIKCFKFESGAYGFKNDLIALETIKYLNVDRDNRFEGWRGIVVRRRDGELIYKTEDASTKKETIRQMEYFLNNPKDWGLNEKYEVL